MEVFHVFARLGLHLPHPGLLASLALQFLLFAQSDQLLVALGDHLEVVGLVGALGEYLLPEWLPSYFDLALSFSWMNFFSFIYWTRLLVAMVWMPDVLFF